MAKDPAFLFYTGDFSTGTQFMTDDQVGKYIRLLMAQHQHGRLSEKQVIFICKSFDEEVMSKFKKDDAGLFYNERLETEVSRRKSFSESRSNNKKGKTKDISNTSKSYDLSSDNHMEDKDKNETKDKEVKKKAKVRKDFEPPTFESFDAYFKENGYGHISEKVFKYYSTADWHDSQGAKVKNWKQKVQGVWFRDENKDKGQINGVIKMNF